MDSIDDIQEVVKNVSRDFSNEKLHGRIFSSSPSSLHLSKYFQSSYFAKNMVNSPGTLHSSPYFPAQFQPSNPDFFARSFHPSGPYLAWQLPPLRAHDGCPVGTTRESLISSQSRPPPSWGASKDYQEYMSSFGCNGPSFKVQEVEAESSNAQQKSTWSQNKAQFSLTPQQKRLPRKKVWDLFYN